MSAAGGRHQGCCIVRSLRRGFGGVPRIGHHRLDGRIWRRDMYTQRGGTGKFDALVG